MPVLYYAGEKEFLGGNYFMKKSLFQKVICFVLSVATLFSVVAFAASAGDLKPDTTAATLEEMKSVVGMTSYSDYLEAYQNAESGSAYGSDAIVVPLDAVTGAEKVSESEANSWVDFKNPNYDYENAVYLSATSKATWTFQVDESMKGLYFIKIEYYTCQTSESSISSIERKLLIDEKIPFSEAGHLNFNKNWKTKTVEKVETTDTTEPDNYSVKYETKDDGYYKIVTDIKGGKKTVTTHKISQDINGNSMAPEIAQTASWGTYYCQDTTGYYDSYFKFYILNGTHTLTLEAEREPMVVSSIELVPATNTEESIPTYAEFKEKYKDKTAPQNGTVTVIEAEFPDIVSDSSVYATNDNTSAGTYPISSKAQLYNVIGENSYKTVGQWAAYKFKVNESGMYKFSMRYKQDALQGMYICRCIKLAGGDYGLADGTPSAPFLEAYNAQFNYDKDWQSDYISDGNGNEFEFYFEKGVEYTVYLECSLGSLKELIKRVEDSLDSINDCYLKILQLTGNDPDEYRDYKFLDVMPEVLYELLNQAIELDNVKKEFEKLCGTGSHTTTLETIAILLDKMGSDDGFYIAANMSTLKSYLGTLGTWINNSKSSSMVVDSISVSPVDASDKEALKRAKPNFFKSLWHEVKSFFYSFFTEYDQMGLTTLPTEDTKTIDVWLATGRDQSQIWRTMIDAKDSFTDSTGTAVTLKLVTGGTLLPSILSGKGPDVYMGLGSSDVINYAIRDAVLGVSGNDKRLTETENEIFSSNYYTYKNADGTYVTLKASETYTGDGVKTAFNTKCFDDVIGFDIKNGIQPGDDYNFVEAAMDTVTLLDVTYGIPQTMGFSMMFYRMDVLAELGEEVPESWDELLSILPVLQTNNMSIGVNYIAAIDFMIYQKGGNMWKYPNDPDYQGAKIDLDSNVALEAFDYVCRLYSDYSFPVSYDAANRFRTGEMPIIIGDYASIYNQLVVYATEIEGLWEFTSLPGSWREKEDGTKEFNYDSLAGIGAAVILHGCDDLLSAWQYVQWETSADIQANYGNKMVALIGPSAKYESANVKALENLSWTASEKAAIKEQMAHLSSIVNYPGSYIINRYTKFAFLAAVNDGANAVDALKGYIDTINAEIKRKREEFDLPTLEPGEEPPSVTAAS